MLKIEVKERLERRRKEVAVRAMDDLRTWTLARFMRLPSPCRMACMAALELDDDVQAFRLIKRWF